MTDRRRAALAGLAVVALYLVLAAVSGGLSPLDRAPLLDGFAPPPPYRWVSPPPDLGSTNKQPAGGRFTIRLTPGTGSRANVYSTGDDQLSLAIGQGAIPPRPGDQTVTLTMTPLAPSGDERVPRKLQIGGNLYRVQAVYQPSGTPLARFRSPARVVLAYPLPVNVAVYHHTLLHSDDARTWTTVRSSDSLVGQLVHADYEQLGYFSVGQAVLATSSPPSPITSRRIYAAILVASGVILLLAIVAGIRRRARRPSTPKRPPRRPPPPRRRADPWDE